MNVVFDQFQFPMSNLNNTSSTILWNPKLQQQQQISSTVGFASFVEEASSFWAVSLLILSKKKPNLTPFFTFELSQTCSKSCSRLQNKRQPAKKINPDHPENINIEVKCDEGSDPGIVSKDGYSDSIEEPEIMSDDSIPITREAERLNEEDTRNSSAPEVVDSVAEAKIFPNEIVPLLSTNTVGKSEGGEQLSGIHLEDLIGMIRNAGKNIHPLNDARIRALDGLEKILCEKEASQGEINILETKLAETDALLRVAAQEKIHVELLEDQLEKLRSELSSRNSSEGIMYDVNASIPFSQINDVNSCREELELWRTENISLKHELETLKTELNNLKKTDERVHILEKEPLSLESSIKKLESKLFASQKDISKLSSLKSECKSLYEKV